MGIGRSLHADRSVLKQTVRPGTWRRMFQFVWPYRRILIGFLLVVVVDAGISVLNPLIYREIINGGILGRNAGLVVKLALLLAGLSVFDAGLSILMRWVSAKVGESLIFDLRTNVFGHVQRMPLAFFTRTQTGALISRLNSDVLGAQQAFTDTLSSVVSNVITVLLTLGTMLVLSWQITLVALVILPVFVIPAKRMGNRLAAITRESYNLNAEMHTTMSERFNVAGALLVKLFGRPGEELSEFSDRAGRVRDIGVKSAMYARLFFVALMLTASVATALVYGWGGVLAIHGILNVGTVVAMTAYLNRLYAPLIGLSNVQLDVMTALVSFDRVFEVLDLPPMIAEKPDAVDIPKGPATIQFRHVDFTYPSAEEVSLASLESVAVLDNVASAPVLFDIDFTAAPGQLVALVGPSGAGKTTISYLTARIYDTRGGAVRINGVDLKDATMASLSDTVGMVTQDAHLFHDTIRANLRYAKPDATDEEIVDALHGAQISSLVESLPQGLDTVVGDRGYRLSGGEKQRLAIARLMLKAPSVVVLDEATAHLDSESEAALQEALSVALRDRTSLVIAHRLSTVRAADQILVIDGGRIVERGTHDELIAEGGLYSELYRTQFGTQAAITPQVAD
ncbi:MAG TPA: ABC transporter ATP-binding protein [Pseudonocardiaceae bacterium]|jgi:ATP-binding cassette subfamily B protein|nr:ABC transporter ATP-binding protein [Pseudonocardiaceae bacterium]